MRKTLFLFGAAAGLVACGQSSDNAALTNSVANSTAVEKPKPAYCFFKDGETKAWAAKRGKDGNIIVTGKAYREDSRYNALLGPPAISGATASIAPTITVNDTGYGAVDNWWDVKATIPDSRAVDTVDVKCGQRTLAELKVRPKS